MFSCPVQSIQDELVTLAHGAGGAEMQKVIHEFSEAFSLGNNSQVPSAMPPHHDGAVVEAHGKIAFSTDSYVVKPLCFPGGDIGKLAVYGTCNDLAVCGASPRYLSCALIIEEGFPRAQLREISLSMAAAAREVGVRIVTGDTKVVPRGDADQLFINTAGVGWVETGCSISSAHIQAGDKIILSSDIGRHGLAILSARQNIRLRTPIVSDCAYIGEPIFATLRLGRPPRFVRDLTRGGLGCVLHEVARDLHASLLIDEEAILVSSPVRSLCEILGLEAINLANEGCFMMVVEPGAAEETLAVLRQFESCRQACVIGVVQSVGLPNLGARGQGRVELQNSIGGPRLFPYLSGEILPRIC